jgi:thiol-disulfide isomerase/thioredoxin
MRVDLYEIRAKTLPVNEYILSLEPSVRDKFLFRKKTYKLQSNVADELRQVANRFIVVVFSASWCKDCAKQLPVLALIAETCGFEVRVFGGLKKDPLSHTNKWRIPPSPPEVKTFKVGAIPLMVVVDSNGLEVGRIVEKPKIKPTLEQELLEAIKSSEHRKSWMMRKR